MQMRRWSRWCAIAGLVTATTAATAATAAPAATAPAAPAPATTPATAGAAAAPATTAPPTPTSTPPAPPATAVQPPPAGGGSAAPAAAATAGTPMTRTAYRAALDRASSDYNRKRAGCRSLKGNERSVCVAEAKAESTKAESAAEAAFRNTPRARMDARVAAANADYSVAKARCNDRSGSERRACLKTAKDRQSQAVSAAMRAPG